MLDIPNLSCAREIPTCYRRYFDGSAYERSRLCGQSRPKESRSPAGGKRRAGKRAFAATRNDGLLDPNRVAQS
jgi:hypothetical protein